MTINIPADNSQTDL